MVSIEIALWNRACPRTFSVLKCASPTSKRHIPTAGSDITDHSRGLAHQTGESASGHDHSQQLFLMTAKTHGENHAVRQFHLHSWPPTTGCTEPVLAVVALNLNSCPPTSVPREHILFPWWGTFLTDIIHDWHLSWWSNWPSSKSIFLFWTSLNFHIRWTESEVLCKLTTQLPHSNVCLNMH